MKLTLDNIPKNDLKTIEFLSKAENCNALFQFSSNVSTKYLRETIPTLDKKLKLNRKQLKDTQKVLSELDLKKLNKLEETDLISLLAIIQTIIRPSARNSGSSKRFILKFNGVYNDDSKLPLTENTLLHKIFCKHTEETFNECLFQEQFMFMLNELFKLDDLGKADIYRRKFESNDKEALDLLKQEYWNIYKSLERVNILKEFWNFLVDLGKYGFNKSHAVSYAILSYYTAYFLANYAKYFISTCIPRCVKDGKSEAHEKIERLIIDARNMNIDVKLPVVNNSYAKPMPDKHTETIYLSADIVSGIGENLSKTLAKKNNFKNLQEFMLWTLEQTKLHQSDDIMIDDKETKIFNKTSFHLLTKIGFFKPFYKDYSFEKYYDQCIDDINSFSIDKIEMREKTFVKKYNDYKYNLKDNAKFKEVLIEDYDRSCKISVQSRFLNESIEKEKKVNQYQFEYDLLKFVLSNPFEKYGDKHNTYMYNEKFEYEEITCLIMIKKVTTGTSKFKVNNSNLYSKVICVSNNPNMPNEFYANGFNLTNYKYGDIVYVKYRIVNEKFKFVDSELLERIITVNVGKNKK